MSRLRRFFRSCLIQSENKFRSGSFRADYIDILIVGVNDFLDDGQSQAGALPVFAPGRVNLIKPVPDFGNGVPRNSDAVIPHGYGNFAVAFCGFHLYGRIIAAEFDGVVNKVVQHLLDFSIVSGDLQGLSGQEQLDRNMFGGAGSLKGGGGILDNSVDVEICNIQQIALGVYIVQRQHAPGKLI